MKKIVTILLAVVMIAALCGCKGTEQTAAEFKVGFGRVDITPTEMGVPLGGYGQAEKRLHTQVLDRIYVSAVAITGTNGETIILISTDLLNSAAHNSVREQIEQTLGIPYSNIMYASTHNHSGPTPETHINGGYMGTVVSKAVQAAEIAMQDQAPATISIARTETDGLNFMRHYAMNDGTYAGSNFGDWSSGIKGHAAENDPQMQLIKFTRGEDKKDIVMVNWQGHPCMTGGVTTTDLSADYIGAVRQQFEFQSKCQFIYFLGASGDQNVKSLIESENKTHDYQEMGKLLAGYIMDAMENMEEVPVGEVKAVGQDYMGTVNREMEDHLADAARVKDLYQTTNLETGNKLARELGFSSVYHATNIIRRSGITEDKLPIGLGVYTFGDIAFTSAPYEMFAVHGTHIKGNSPYKMTFVATCTNGSLSYLPTQTAYDYGCYESHIGTFTGSTGQECAETLVEMLKNQKG